MFVAIGECYVAIQKLPYKYPRVVNTYNANDHNIETLPVRSVQTEQESMVTLPNPPEVTPASIPVLLPAVLK